MYNKFLRIFLEKTYVIEDCWELVDSSNPQSIVSQYYNTPVEITGKVKKNGTWGGTRLYGADNSHNYVFLSQNSSNVHESEKIWYVVGSSWVNFKAIIGNNEVSLYINDSLIQTVTTDTSGQVRLWAGSTANPVSLDGVKIKKIKAL